MKPDNDSQPCPHVELKRVNNGLMSLWRCECGQLFHVEPRENWLPKPLEVKK